MEMKRAFEQHVNNLPLFLRVLVSNYGADLINSFVGSVAFVFA